MRIGIDAHNLEGQPTGVGRYLWNLLKEWAMIHEDHEFFLYFKEGIPDNVQTVYAKNGRGSSTVRILNTKSNAFFKHILLPREIARDKIDIFFCPDYVLPFYVPPRIKMAVTIHDIFYEARPKEYPLPSFEYRILLTWAAKYSAKKAHIIFSPSEFTKNEILTHYKVNPHKIIVTPLAPDPIFKEATADEGAIRKKYRLQDNFVLFVGSIFNRRYLPEKIQAFGYFARSYRNFQFLIIGNNHTKPYQNIAAYIKKLNGGLGREAVVWEKYIG